MFRLLAAPALLVCCLSACGGPTLRDDYAGTWGDRRGVRHISIQPDGTASGFDGCKSFSASWSDTGDAITFEPVGFEPLYACAGFSDYFSTTWDHAALVGDALEVYAEDGRIVGTFHWTSVAVDERSLPRTRP